MVEDAGALAEFVWGLVEMAFDWFAVATPGGDDRARPVPRPEQEQRPPPQLTDR